MFGKDIELPLYIYKTGLMEIIASNEELNLSIM